MRLLLADEEIIAGGVETLRHELVPELARLCEAIIWALPAGACRSFRERLGGVPRLQIESLSLPRTHPLRIGSALVRRCPGRGAHPMLHRLARWQIDSRLGALARRHRCTHLLTTCVFSQSRPRVALPTAGFVCDVNPALPESARRNILDWVRHAAATFAISEFTADELRRIDPSSAPRIHAIPLAPPPASLSSSSSQPFDFYFPAAANPHKGHATLFAACDLLAARGHHFRLVLSGPGTDVFRTDPLAAHLDVRGDLPADQVQALFAAAGCIVLPTTYEGFGLPLAEALRHGKSVVCTDIPPLREQLDRHASHDRARLVPPGDPARLADALEQQLRAPLPPLPIEEIDRRLARWNWPAAARRCRDLLATLKS